MKYFENGAEKLENQESIIKDFDFSICARTLVLAYNTTILDDHDLQKEHLSYHFSDYKEDES